jgi:hypothetical protein
VGRPALAGVVIWRGGRDSDVFGPEAWQIAVDEKPDIEIMIPILLSATLFTFATMLSMSVAPDWDL